MLLDVFTQGGNVLDLKKDKQRLPSISFNDCVCVCVCTRVCVCACVRDVSGTCSLCGGSPQKWQSGCISQTGPGRSPTCRSHS